MKCELETDVLNDLSQNAKTDNSASEKLDAPKPLHSARMAKLLSRTHLVTYFPGLKALHQRAALVCTSRASFSCSSAESGHDLEGVQYPQRTSGISDSDLGPLGPTNRQFPLPGKTGFASQVNAQGAPYISVTHKVLPDVLTKALPQDRHASVLAQFVNSVAESQQEQDSQDAAEGTQFKNHPQALECIAQDCPDNLRQEFLGLFPGLSLESSDKLTVVTLCQRTKNNMTSWSQEVEEERNELLENFFACAQEMCHALADAGYWADFIDPSSGQAFLGDPNPNTTLFETDERFRSLGFVIEDLGCCKCIRHSEWGTHTFVGTIFTTAPPNSKLISSILRETS